MEFKKIQLNGFKSFAEKTNFLIEEGLTGIVGPNGCGKSNIVESLRWVMGETSAKSMRGSGMEDVIFSGTSNKASKNIAEVSIEVENKEKEGPIQYRELENIQVRRKIEKDKGSKFYINDKEVRARDAQMFFADLSTGAHSPSMISQGRIGALVTAKPQLLRSPDQVRHTCSVQPSVFSPYLQRQDQYHSPDPNVVDTHPTTRSC